MPYGICKLTGKKGKLVRSHLLPRALTRTPEPNDMRFEAYPGGTPYRRFDSWYDRNLVTREGEDILAYYDDWAIKELRRTRLVYSGWDGGDTYQGSDIERIGESEWGIRFVECSNPARLRLFFLSLLWRSASSSIFNFFLELKEEQIEHLRRMVVEQDETPLDDFPIFLIQLTTQGPWHNVSPRVELKRFPATEGSPEAFIRVFRFYLEGLIIHIDDHETDPVRGRLGQMAVGSSNKVAALTRPYEHSYQKEWLEEHIFETFAGGTRA